MIPGRFLTRKFCSIPVGWGCLGGSEEAHTPPPPPLTDDVHLNKPASTEKALPVSMDVTSLYANVSLEDGIETLCRAYDYFYKTEIPIPTPLLY